jgi:hypothetical protein
MRTFHIGGENGTRDCDKELEGQTTENRLRSLEVQVRKLMALVDALRCGCQANSEAHEAYERVRVIADGLGLTDRPLNVLFERVR